VKRQGKFETQSSLTEEERIENVKGTFAVRRPELVRGRTILVVDDIMTTGATLGECAKTLKAAGASRVWSVTLARSVRT
jgi:predicted amidophosphoribosyltransferase